MIPSLTRASQLNITRPLVLVGLMGAGKTTVGRRLATKLKLPFYDADEEIELAANMRISEFFEAYGEAAFRDGERKVIERLLNGAPHVLATGGGAFMNDETRALVKAKATSIWLRADLELLVKRTAMRNHRPLLQTGDPRDTLKRLLDERAPTYAQADFTVDSVEGPHAKTVDRVIKALSKAARKGAEI